MLRTLFLSGFLALSMAVSAETPRLSANAQISLITCGAGQQELYSAFGHSALRVRDPQLQIDYIYNYGVFNFDQPHFYLNFARGYLYYQLGVYDARDFLMAYVRYNRSVAEQALLLSPAQKQKLFDYLEWNASPDHQTYRYDYFYNNCATKLRDVVQEVMGDSVRFDGNHITTHYTIRELTDQYLAQQPWGDLGIDICLGLPMDKLATPWDYMFLPDYLFDGFRHAFILTAGGWQPLAAQEHVLFQAAPEDPVFSWTHPWIVIGALSLIILLVSVRDLLRTKITTSLDFILLLATGLIGLLLLLLWLLTDHKAAAWNFNLLWALPTNLAGLYLLLRKRSVSLKKYYLGAALLTVLLLLTWYFLPQQLNLFLLPFVAALGVRYGANAVVLSRQKAV
ncbi:MAG: DUF4105 domain-containing protein [Cyclobacteriaceae bacterium]